MSDEKLRARLLDLHDAAKSVVVPPGMARARQRLRRRRVIRATMASTAVVALGIVALAWPDRALAPPDGPTVQTTAPANPSGSATPTPAPTATATPTPTGPTSSPATAGRSAGASATGAGARG
jgi:hypothetical protein